MIRNRPEKDMEHPPGQIRYLRDVIRKYQEEDRRDQEQNEARKKASKPFSEDEATTPLAEAENLPRELLGASAGALRAALRAKGCADGTMEARERFLRGQAEDVLRVTQDQREELRGRLEGLKQALVRLCNECTEAPTSEIARILKENALN